tara:strand:+ start:115 stop:3063 length:2949 start_codon:yes stop_codon:yes gene_type:complete
MNNFKKLNNITGWLVFLIATIVYLVTMEKSASLWDCGEFISAAYKLEVVHAPGAPFFLMLGRIFSLFAADATQVAIMVNSMSALSSSFTILFLFWTITAFGKKIYSKDGKIEQSKTIAVLGAGVVGSLAYTFSDSFWFSAVEGEVYALSSFFTALTFWCILKWEEVADSPHSSKWLVLIAYLIGLSIGVHLLSLLTIPAMGMIYYFKNNEYTHYGAFKALIISTTILLVIQGILIPKTASLMGIFDRIFVNDFGLPFNSGVLFFFLLIIGLIIFGLFKTREAGNSTWNTAILGILVLLIGYSSYSTVILRASANTPINIGAPDDPLKLSSYLQRDQYGDWPIVSGQQYNQKFPIVNPTGQETIGTEYLKNKEKGIYEDMGNKIKYTYRDKEFFPRMWSDQKTQGYKRWRRANGTDPNSRIKFGENLHFFFDYQIGWSYMRYFMWNFAGRQNDIMNMDQNDIYGNWESGLNFSKYDNAPSHLKDNKAKNHYYLLPLIIGLIGLFFHFKSAQTDAISVLMFFLFTGVLIIVFLNVPPDQPRERDYAYVGSFYAFSIWVGLGVLGIFDYLKTKLNKRISAIIASIICLIAAPALMASENWDDHDRSGRTIAIDVATNYLQQLEPNAIIFSNGDNDTYPLWYAQEVEGVRLDVRNVNMSLLGMDWYIDQVKHKVYDADAVPSLLEYEDYKGNQKNGVPTYKNKKRKSALKAIKEVKSGKGCPKNIFIPIDTSLFSEADKKNWKGKNILNRIELTVKGSRINQHELALLDILANFKFQRPLYFISSQQTLDKFSLVGKGNPTTQEELLKYIGLLDYVQEEGCVSRFVPFRTNYANQQNTETENSFEIAMNDYRFGNVINPEVYYDYYSARSMLGFRYPYLRLAIALQQKGDSDKAIKLADKYFASIPISTDVLDPVSIKMSAIYINEEHKEGYKWSELLLKEYELQNNFLKEAESKGGYLSIDGKRLQQHTQKSIKDLKELRKNIKL